MSFNPGPPGLLQGQAKSYYPDTPAKPQQPPKPLSNPVDATDYLTRTRRVAEELRGFLDSKMYFANCVNCHFFQEATEICTAVAPYNARPPARIIAYGCTMHSSEIPF